MEAKDTVINSEEIERCLYKWNDINNVAMAYGTDSPDIKDMVADFLQAQAKISFQAGKEECAKTHFKPDWIIKAQDIKDATEEGHKAGIKEVVDWMNLNCLGCRSNTFSNTDEYLGFHKESWQAQLKEWFATKNRG